MIKLSLFEKGIAFVSITLLVQLAFVLALALLLRHSHEQIQHERTVREIISQLNKLSGTVDNASVGLTQQVMSPDAPDSDEFKRSYKQYLDKIPQQMQTLEKLTKGTRRYKEMMELSETISSGLQAIDKFRMAAISHSPQRDYLAMVLKDVLLTKTRQVNGLLESFEYDQQAEVKAESQSYDAVLYFLGLGVFANVLLALFLMVAFTRGIAAKVDRIRSNSVRLSAGVPLQAPLENAHDELGQLDSSFHEMAQFLSESIRREQALITNAVDVILSLDKTGICIDVNPAVAVVFGVSPEMIIGRRFLDIMKDEEKETTLDSLLRATDGSELVETENQMKRKDGSTIECAWSARWSPEDNALFCVIHDISQRKQIERLKRDFVSMVSHDLRAPLSSIQLIMQNAVRGIYGGLPDAAQERITMATQSIERLISLVNGLLSMEKLESGDVELDLIGIRADEIVLPAVHLMQELAAKQDVQLSVLEHSNPYFYGDGERLIQVLVNLLSNAIKFSPEHTTVEVSVLDVGHAIRFAVADKGRGVPAGLETKIFERFQQVKASDDSKLGGSGLGLSICKAIVEKHGGSIGVESNNGQGSVFWFELPFSDSEDDDDV
ncbi:MAG: PAS domain S-box protein [Candidatus Melainabacteria bacterium]|nr:PAS domain S-box protein [Candidatus Melainabacteria bacterium]